MIAAMEFDEFFSLVTRTRRGIAQKQRLEKIYRLAAESIGCPMGPAAEFEAELLVVKLKEVREQLKKKCRSNARLLYGVYRVQHSANDSRLWAIYRCQGFSFNFQSLAL
jgi:hypothetical protein